MSQKVSVQFFDPASSASVIKMFEDIIPRGIYKGGYISLIPLNNSQVIVSPLVCMIGDANYQVRMEETGPVTVSGLNYSPLTNYIVLSWTYSPSAPAVVTFSAVSAANIPANSLVVGYVTYDGSVINGIGYGGVGYVPRSNPNVMDLFLKVEPSNDASYPMNVRIRSGRVNYGWNVLTVYEQLLTPAFTAPSGATRVDVIYVDTDGAVKVLAGTEGAGTPALNGKICLASVTLTVGLTPIVSANIGDIRAFVNGQTPLPSQTSNASKFLKTDGSVSSWSYATYAPD